MSRIAEAALLVALVLTVYLPVAGHEFVDYDDYIYIVENPNLRDGPTPAAIAHAFTTPYETNWIPLTWLSLQVDYALFGLEPAGYLLENAALHALSAVLLYLALLRMTGARARSLFVAAVFAVHPLHVESVAWASERKDTLSGVFFMLSLLAYARHAERPGPARLVAVGLFLTLGLLAKPMLVTLPFVLLLLDFWPLGRLHAGARNFDPARVRRALLEKLPLFAVVVALSIATFAVQRERGAMALGDTLPLALRVWNALDAWAVYAVQSFVPTGLGAFYPHPGDDVSVGRALAAGAALLAVTGAAARLAFSRPYLIVGWLWYLGMLVPVIGLVQVGQQARADRYTYLPMIGLGIAVAWGVSEAAARFRLPARVRIAAGAAAVAALAVTAAFQVRHWSDSVALYTRAIEVTGENAFAQNGLGDAYMRMGDVALASRHYAEAERIDPDWPNPRLGRADILASQGRVDAAIEIYEEMLRRAPGHDRASGKYGLALIRVGRHAEALPPLDRALAIHPGSPELRGGRAAALAGLGRYAEAAREGRAALRANPGAAEVANNLAWILATCEDASVRDPQEAVRVARGAVEIAGEHPALLDTLAAAQAAAGRFDEAVRTASLGARHAREAGHPELAREIESRIALYRSGQGYVERAR